MTEPEWHAEARAAGWISPQEHAAHDAFYKLTISQRDQAWREIEQLKSRSVGGL